MPCPYKASRGPAKLTPMEFRFEVLKTDPTGARLGRLTTPHGVIDTPTFMPVGTQGTVKGLTQQALGDLGVQILLGNTYHLYLRPGHERVRPATYRRGDESGVLALLHSTQCPALAGPKGPPEGRHYVLSL